MVKTKLGNGMLYAGLFAIYLGTANPGHIAAKPIEQPQRLEDITLADSTPPIGGLVINSNKNSALAYTAVEMLHANHFEDAFIMKVEVGDKTFYRTVIPYKHASEQVDNIKKSLKKLAYFSDSDKAFKTDLPKNFKLNSQTQEDSSVVSSSDAIKDSEGWTRQNYIDNFADMAMKRYNYGRSEQLSKPIFENAVGWIFDYATEFNIPILPTLAVAFQESAMNPYAIGDKKLKGRNTAHGLMQIRIPTIKTVINMMKRDDYSNVPSSVDAAISNPQDLARLGVYHFAECYRRANENINGALACHNQGLNSSFDTSTSYVRKVKSGLSKLEDVQDQFHP